MATAKKRLRGHDVSGPIQDKIRGLALARGWAAIQIREELFKDVPEAARPSLRTVQRIVKEVAPSTPSEVWTFADAAPDEPPVVMPVLNALTTSSNLATVSRAEVAWLMDIHRAAADLHPLAKWLLARTLVLGEGRRPPDVLASDWTASVNCFLAFAPWRSAKARRAYQQATRSGNLPCSKAINVMPDGWSVRVTDAASGHQTVLG